MIPALALVLVLFVLASPAEAYVDPGSGSMLLQLLLGGAMAGLVMFRSVLRRVRGLFQRSGPPSDTTAD